MSHAPVKILDGNTFVVSDERGDIEASPVEPTGLFSYDTRFLSTWVLSIDDHRLSALSVDDLQGNVLVAQLIDCRRPTHFAGERIHRGLQRIARNERQHAVRPRLGLLHG